MKLRWLAILCALSVAVPACDSKSKAKASKEDDEEEEKSEKKEKKEGKDKKSGDKPSADAPTTAGASTPAADDEPPPPPAPTEAAKPPMTKEQVSTFLKDESAKLTPEAYESLLLGVADCKLEKYGVDSDCQGKKDLSASYKHKNDEYKKTNEVALKHLRHPSPAVRYEATSNAQSAAFGYDAKDDASKLYIDALRAEKDDYVLAHLVAAHSGVRKSDRLRKYVFRYVDHKDARVREAALRVLSDQEVAADVKGHYEKFLEKTEKDSDERVRAEACEGLGASNNPAAITTYQKLLEASDTPDEVKEGCFSGLIQSWIDIPYPKKPSKEGYELTLKLLEKPGRTDKFPPWKGISKIGWAKTEFKPYDSAKEWYAVAKPFYDKARVVKAVEALALDEKAGNLARDQALGVLKSLGEQKLLETMAPTLKGQKGDGAKRLAERAEKLSKEKDN